MDEGFSPLSMVLFLVFIGLEAAFYGTNQARSAFYPSIVLSGSAGWTNSAGSMIVNPQVPGFGCRFTYSTIV